ncbi:hypothetical protein [Tenacibaculum ovolyticum]|uniref:hypothetical protein n=1 Tax=Tenacibaculum ovolyticum TaxID=104270 RepID=UPI00041FB03B|nr:hypothetical protein [Tenacibaculum ovolyticum]
MELKEIIKKFILIFGRDNTDIGEVKFIDINCSSENSLNLLYDYLEFDKTITIGGELYIDLYPKRMQSKVQEGWYVLRSNEGEKYDDLNWNKDWIVFATRNGDAIYFDKTSKEVYGSINKTTRFKLADSLAMFFKIMVEGMKIEQEKYNLEAFDEDEETLPDFIEDIKNIFDKNLDNKYQSDFISFFFE